MKKKKVEDVRKEPLPLLEGFEWKDVDVTKEADLDRLYEFLKANYVEDEDHMFRFDYSKEFLKWHLTAPGCYKNWILSVVREDKVKNKKKMVGFISGIPVKVSINGEVVQMAEINFLCVKREVREHRLAPKLIQEVTRRINCEGIWQAVYTSGTMLPKPWAKCLYYHRNLNVKKLVECRFSYLPQRMNMARAIKIYSLPTKPYIEGFRRMEEKDVDQITEMLSNYEEKFKVHGFYNKEEVAHWFLPRKQVVYSYVREAEGDGIITDFFSFYSLPSSVLQSEKHKKLWAAYSFFNIATTIPLKDLVKTALIYAKNENFDVFNCLDIMENETVFKDLLFGKGDGKLKYYLWNFVCPETQPKDLAIVLM